MKAKRQITNQAEKIAEQINLLKSNIQHGMLTKDEIINELNNLLCEVHEIHNIYYRETVIKEKERIERIENPEFFF
jgi:hypothetical protein